MKKIILPFKLFGLLFLGFFLFEKGSATIHTIQVSDFQFSPASIHNVVPGDTIRWTWLSGTHTTTSVSVPSGAASWDEPISSASPSFDYIVTAEGTYQFRCTPHPNMTASFSTSGTTTGITNTKTNRSPGVRIFPNPFKTTFNIDVTGKDFNEAVLTDVLGKVIFYLPLEPNCTSIDRSRADLTNLPDGVYFLTLKGNRKEKYTTRIVKNSK